METVITVLFMLKRIGFHAHCAIEHLHINIAYLSIPSLIQRRDHIAAPSVKSTSLQNRTLKDTLMHSTKQTNHSPAPSVIKHLLPKGSRQLISGFIQGGKDSGVLYALKHFHTILIWRNI